MSDPKVFKLKIAGQAGQGIKSSGLLFSKFVSRSGFYIYNYIEYPSIIRGGHNVLQINISSQEVLGPSRYCDFLIALNQESVLKHRDTMSEGGFILYDSETKINTEKLPAGINLLAVPLNKLAHDAGGKDLLANVVALGVTACMMSGSHEILEQLVREEYGHKKDILESDLLAINLGYKYCQDNFSALISKSYSLTQETPKAKSVEKMVINGDEAAALGAIAAGLQFAAIYPMSPISNILHTLAKYQFDYGYVYKQPEDELSAINMAIGASYAGARSLTATSGGGFCLMTEAYGLAGMTETPLVIIEGMRGGPATGLPTWSAQGDLQFVLHAHQEEFPRIVLAAADNIDAFYMTMEAFYLADKYQTPVVVLLDKNICDHEQTVPVFDTTGYKIDRGKLTTKMDPAYKRYLVDIDGISVRTLPGYGNFFIANSDEHTETGFSSEEAENRVAQMNKRMIKLETCAKQDMPEPDVFGSKDAELSVVSWGSSKGSILQALKSFNNVNYLHLGWMNPFPTQFVTEFLKNAKNVLLIESNYTGQLGNLITEKTGFKFENKYLKYDGRPFYVEEMADTISKFLSQKKGAAQ